MLLRHDDIAEIDELCGALLLLLSLLLFHACASAIESRRALSARDHLNGCGPLYSLLAGDFGFTLQTSPSHPADAAFSFSVGVEDVASVASSGLKFRAYQQNVDGKRKRKWKPLQLGANSCQRLEILEKISRHLFKQLFAERAAAAARIMTIK